MTPSVPSPPPSPSSSSPTRIRGVQPLPGGRTYTDELELVPAEGPIDPETFVRFVSAAPYRRASLEVEAPSSARPTALLAALSTDGWSVTTMVPDVTGSSSPATLADAPATRERLVLDAPGSGRGGTWTDVERALHLGAARRVLRRFGYLDVPVVRLRSGPRL